MTRTTSGAFFLTLLALTVLGNRPAVADWWYTYEADGTFPEDEGWGRIVGGGGAQRSFEDGALVLDGSASIEIYDSYYRYMPSLPDPNDPSSVFVFEWRLRVDSLIGFTDPGVSIVFKDFGDVILGYQMGRIYSFFEGKYIAEFEPGVFHSYVLATSDMQTYTLAIDGLPGYTGDVSPYATGSFVQFGDRAQGSASVSRWDYVRLGVTTVPEPTVFLLLGAAAAGFGSRWARRNAQ